jgi:pyruvate formate lyase activating enzyme
MIHEALYFEKLDDQEVRCKLCPAECRLKPGQRGICRCRFNDNGTLKTDNFGETVTIAIDPMEKKPLYHFLPTTDIVSIGVNGCNLSCLYCQNWQISQEKVGTTYIDPMDLPQVASQQGSVGIAYTYTEPLIWYEYILESAPLIRDAGLVNVMVTNGYINPEPLKRLLPLIDAFNIDLKAMRPDFYAKICKGKLEPVLEVIRLVAASSAHLELTNLVIPGLNDSEEDFHKLGEFVASVGQSIPFHLSVYHPSYRLDNPRTPPETMKRAYRIMRQYLANVFVGNMEIDGCSNTYCRACGDILVERSWYHVKTTGLDQDGKCRKCGAQSDIILKK